MSEAAMKALGLVDAVAHASVDGLGGMEAANLAGLDKSTASRLLRTLTERGWLVRDQGTRRYFPGTVLLSVARAVGFSQEAHAIVNTALEDLSHEVGETVALHHRRGNLRVCASGVESREEVRTGLRTGDSQPLTKGASGKVILAFCETELRDQLTHGQPPPERAKLVTQLQSAEQHGYLSTESDNTWGVGAISVPLFDRLSILGALTIAGPAWRFDAAQRLGCLPALFEAAMHVSLALGGSADRYAAWPEARSAVADSEPAARNGSSARTVGRTKPSGVSVPAMSET